MIKSRKSLRVAMLCGMLVATIGIVGCTFSAMENTEGTEETNKAGNIVEQWAEKYPLEYASSMSGESTSMEDHDHTRIVSIMEAPLVRDEYGYFQKDDDGNYLIEGLEYDHDKNQFVIAGGPTPSELSLTNCLSCKSSVLNDFYDEYGDEAFSMDFSDEVVEQLDGRYWDCGSCHEGDPAESKAQPQLMFYNGLVRDAMDGVSEEITSCGQCHNYFNYRRAITSIDDYAKYEPYAKGFDADGLYETLIEDGLTEPDEETGLIEVGPASHADMEMYMTSTHYSLGLTCVSCHMPSMESEDGTAYTNHNASGSPLEKEEALELCLSCHDSQGIETTEDLVAMVKDVQASAAEKETELIISLEELKAAYLEAKESGTVSESVLEEVADNFGHAHWYVGMCYDLETDPGVKAAMFSDVTTNLLERAETLINDSFEMLAQLVWSPVLPRPNPLADWAFLYTVLSRLGRYVLRIDYMAR